MGRPRHRELQRTQFGTTERRGTWESITLRVARSAADPVVRVPLRVGSLWMLPGRVDVLPQEAPRQSTQNSLSSGSAITTWSGVPLSSASSRITVAPAVVSRSTAEVTRGHRTSHGSARPSPTCTSRWTRFFTTLVSGTFRKEMPGRTPSGSSIEAPSSHSSSGTPNCVSHSCQLPKPLRRRSLDVSQRQAPERRQHRRARAIDRQSPLHGHQAPNVIQSPSSKPEHVLPLFGDRARRAGCGEDGAE